MVHVSPSVLVFDVVETLFRLDRVAGLLRVLGQPEGTLSLFFADLLRDGFALEASGVFRSFPEVATGALVRLLGHEQATDAVQDRLLKTFRELDPHEDAGPALRLADQAGFRIVALTNGSAQTTDQLLNQAGLSSMFERVISIDSIGHWKPHPEVYRHAVQALGTRPGETVLIAAHDWDVHGAAQAGWKTGLVSRKGRLRNPAMTAPFIEDASLEGVVRKLVSSGNSH